MNARRKRISAVCVLLLWLVLIQRVLPLLAQDAVLNGGTSAPVHFARAIDYAVGGDPISIAAADVNGDAVCDLIVGGMDGTFRVLLGQNGSTFPRTLTVRVPSPSWCFVTGGDLNGDGKRDVVITSADRRNNSVGVYLSKGDGTFSEAFFPLPKSPQVINGMWERPRAVLDDFNLDDRLDIVVPDLDRGGILILKGKGDGTFESPLHFNPGSTAQAIVTGTFSKNSAPDILTASWNNALTLINEIGSSSSTTAHITKDPNLLFRAVSLTTGDFNRDGALDIAAVRQNQANGISVLLNRWDGQFRSVDEFASGNLPVAIASADFNSDGLADLVTANWQSSDLTVLFGNGNGTFEPPKSLQTPLRPFDVLAGDFNQDGRPDLAYVNYLHHTVGVFLNRTGTLPTETAGFSELARSDQTTAPQPPVPTNSSFADKKTKYKITSWTTDNGLPQNNVKCILQTRDGFLWIGTQNGLARFDGRDFRIFDRTSNPPLLHCNINCLTEDQDGTLWIGAFGGLARFREGTFEFFPLHSKDGALAEVQSIVAQSDRPLFLSSNEGMQLFDGQRFSEASTNLRLYGQPGLLAQGRDGSIWGVAAGVLTRFSPNGEQVDRVYHARPFADPVEMRSICAGKDGKIWFGTADLACWNNGSIGFISNRDEKWWGLVTSVVEDSLGRIWFGTQDGLRLLQGNDLVEYTTREGLSDTDVSCIYPDREGNIWVGTGAGGLNCLQPRRVITYTDRDGLANNDVWSISEARDGSLWIATVGGASKLRDGKFVSYDGNFHVIQEDSTGAVWAGEKQLFELQGQRFAPVTNTPGWFPGPSTAYLDRKGDLWLADQIYLISRQRDGWTNRAKADWLTLSPHLVGVLRDPSDNLWVGSERCGLFHIRGDKVDRLTAADGLTSDYVAPVLSEPDGTLWIASDKGLNRLKNGRITRYTTADGLAEDIVLNVLEDDNGWFWLNGHRGIHRVRKQELNELAEGKRTSVESITYGTAEGLLSAEGNGGRFPNSCKTRDGRLWFPTTKGLVMIDPRQITQDETSPPVWINRIRANDQIIFDDGFPRHSSTNGQVGMWGEAPAEPSRHAREERQIRLAPGAAGVIHFEYTAPIFAAPERARFKYRLEGYDANWHEAGNERRAVYTNLRPGDYRFHVIARSSLGVWNEVGDSIRLYLAPHFYQTSWFYGACAAAVLLAISGVQGYRLRLQRRILNLQHQATVARERERIARDLHDDVGASLTRIALLSEVVRRELGSPESAATHIEKISAISGEVVDSIGEVVWAANPKYDNLESLVAYFREYAAECFSALGIALRFNSPPDLQARALTGEFRRQLFLVVKEALNNIGKHAQATQVQIALAIESNELMLTISDNGQGVTADRNGNYHHGLENMRERVEKLGGSFSIESQPGKGVRINVRVPMPEKN